MSDIPVSVLSDGSGSVVMGCPPLQAGLSLYPTVGLQTPGEVVEANFGESPFVFDFEGLLMVSQPSVPLSWVSPTRSA